MKKTTRAFIIFVFIISVGASFYAGSYLKEYTNSKNRKHGCSNLLSFAIDKINTEDLNDPDTMEAFISNIYAAYMYCDKPAPSQQLHDLWNTLVFEGESYIGKEDALLETLENIAASVMGKE